MEKGWGQRIDEWSGEIGKVKRQRKFLTARFIERSSQGNR